MQLRRGMCTLHALNCKHKGGLISVRFVSRNSIFIGFVAFRLISFRFTECDMSTERTNAVIHAYACGKFLFAFFLPQTFGAV